MALDPDAERLVRDGPPAVTGRDLLDCQPVWNDVVPLEQSDDIVTISGVRRIRVVVIGIDICHSNISGPSTKTVPMNSQPSVPIWM